MAAATCLTIVKYNLYSVINFGSLSSRGIISISVAPVYLDGLGEIKKVPVCHIVKVEISKTRSLATPMVKLASHPNSVA